MTSAPTALCDTCGEPLRSSQLTGGHCSRCLFMTTFSDEDAPLEEEDMPAPWTRLSGCELHEEIGRGGMGVVYRARQKALNRTVAVKVLLRAHFAGREERERFYREAQAAARLQHPGIVGIFDVGEDDDVPWFSMEYIAGQNLERAVREHPMEARAAAQCVQQVALALQHAHDHGVLHRDLKPSNILLDKNGSPRITDFGIARIATTGTSHGEAELTRTGQVLGSPGYAAPEQVLSGQTDTLTDVYGLGSLLYHLLTGRPPFQGPTLDAILVQLRENEPLSPRKLNPTVPQDLETICLKCLHKQPGGRYASSRDMAEDLGRFLSGEPILARPPNPLGRLWRSAKRYPVLASMTVVIGLLLLAMAAGSAAFIRHQARREQRAALISEARSLRQQRLAENRGQALHALQKAWAIAPLPEIRNEAIACLALPEIHYMYRAAPGTPEAQAPAPSRSADGRCIARFEGADLIVIQVAEQKEIARLSGYRAGSLMKLDDHGTRLAIAAPKSGKLEIVSLKDSAVLATCQHPVALSSLDWSGDLIATGCDNRFIYIWDDAGHMKHRLSGHEAIPIRVSFRPRSQELCSTAEDPHIRLWHAARGVEIIRREVKFQPHTALWWSADGTRLHAGLTDGAAEVFPIPASPCFDLLSPPQDEPHTENLGSADLSDDGQMAAVVDEECCRLWNFKTGRLVTTFGKLPAQWLSAQFAEGDQKLWVCGWDHELVAYPLSRNAEGTVQTGPPSPPYEGKGSLLREVKADGSMLVLSNNDRGQFLVVWPATRKVLPLKEPGTLATTLAKDGRWIMTSSYQRPGVQIWSVPEGKVIRQLSQDAAVKTAVLSADGLRLIAVTSKGDRCYDTGDWSEISVIPPKLKLRNIAASNDGRWIASLGDNEIHLLEATTFREVAQLIPPAYVGWLGESHLVFDADSTHLLVHTALGSVARWDLARIHEELEKLGMKGLVPPKGSP